MEGMSVTGIWMAGVVGMMLVFGMIAFVGIQLDQARDNTRKQNGAARSKND